MKPDATKEGMIPTLGRPGKGACLVASQLVCLLQAGLRQPLPDRLTMRTDHPKNA